MALKRIKQPRRGVASMMAMLFLVLVSSLAIGFYAMTNSNAQVVHNEMRVNNALMASESGMDFIRFHLASTDIPYNTAPENLFTELTNDLRYQLNGTPNLGGASIHSSSELIRIPANPTQFISLNDGRQFRVLLENKGQKVNVKVIGKHGVEMARGVKLEYGLAEKAGSIFDYGIASRGKVTTEGTARIRGATDPKKGSILSTSTDPIPVVVNGSEVSGDVSLTNPGGIVTVGAGTSIGGTTVPAEIQQHIHKGVPEPAFPEVNTDVFYPYVLNPDGTPRVYSGGSTIDNMIIPANTNPNFTSSMTIRGVMYIQAPNTVTFRGSVTVQGVIAVENNAPGTLLSNVLDFRGNVNVSGVSTLPESYGDLRKLTGAVILAPNFHTRFSGNFGEINGHILTDKATFDGNASGVVKGSIVTLEAGATNLVKGSSEIIIASTGTTNYPAGVYFSSNYRPLKDTYEEIKPE